MKRAILLRGILMTAALTEGLLLWALRGDRELGELIIISRELVGRFP